MALSFYIITNSPLLFFTFSHTIKWTTQQIYLYFTTFNFYFDRFAESNDSFGKTCGYKQM